MVVVIMDGHLTAPHATFLCFCHTCSYTHQGQALLWGGHCQSLGVSVRSSQSLMARVIFSRQRSVGASLPGLKQRAHTSHTYVNTDHFY